MFTTRTIILCALLCGAISYAQKQITPADAKQHEGELATVCGYVASVHTASRSRGEPTFINLDRPYPNQVFTALVWGDDRGRVAIPRNGERVCVTGTVADYRGVPEIVVHDSAHITAPQR